MRDVGPGETKDPRVALQMAFGELGELRVVVRGQVVADLAELLVHDVEIVDKPFGGWRDPSFVLDGPGEHAVGLQQDAAVLSDAGLDIMSAMWCGGDPLRSGKGLRVLLQPLHAEELGEDRLFGLGLLASAPADSTGRVSKGPVRMHLPPFSARTDPAYVDLDLGNMSMITTVPR